MAGFPHSADSQHMPSYRYQIGWFA